MATALRSSQAKSSSRRNRQTRSQQRSHLQAVRPENQSFPTHTASPRLAVVSPTTIFSPTSVESVRKLPIRRALPPWLKLLMNLQRGSVIVTFVLMTAALVVYGSTIYMQQHWSKGYNKLKTMQRSERQMIAAEGLIKNQLIQQAEQPGSGLVPRTAEHTIVLEPAPERAVPITANPVLKVEPSTQSQPLGY